MLKIENLSKNFGGVQALDRVDIHIEAGITAIIGPNGAGKTTLFNIISGLMPPTAGNVLFEEKKISGKRMDQITRLGISRTFQNLGVFPNLTVEENLVMGMFSKIKAGYFNMIFDSKRLYAELDSMLRLMKIEDFRYKAVKELPFGIQRLVDLCRASICNPKLLLLDEPASGLSVLEKRDFLSAVNSLSTEKNIKIVIIEHDMGLVMNLVNEIFVLDNGRKIAQGKPSEILQNKIVHDAYLGCGD